MIGIAKRLPCVAAIAGVVMLGIASPARADIELQLISGTSTQTVSSPVNTGPIGYSSLISGNVGSFFVLGSIGSSNSPGGAAALTEEGSFILTNTSNIAQTITIEVSAQGFTAPHSPPALMLGDTVAGAVSGGTVSGSVQAYADATNALFGTGFQDSGLNLTIPATTGPARSFMVNGAALNGFNAPASGYSLTFVENLTFSAGASLTLTGGNVATLPEPSSMMAAFAAMPFLAIGAWLRRRRQVAIA